MKKYCFDVDAAHACMLSLLPLQDDSPPPAPADDQPPISCVLDANSTQCLIQSLMLLLRQTKRRKEEQKNYRQKQHRYKKSKNQDQDFGLIPARLGAVSALVAAVAAAAAAAGGKTLLRGSSSLIHSVSQSPRSDDPPGGPITRVLPKEMLVELIKLLCHLEFQQHQQWGYGGSLQLTRKAQGIYRSRAKSGYHAGNGHASAFRSEELVQDLQRSVVCRIPEVG